METFKSSYCPNYFSIEDILATQERVPVEVETDLKNLGFLDQGADNMDLARGTKLELPYWCVEGLNKSDQSRSYLMVDIPKTFKEMFREIMSADPLVVDLHKMGPYYYEFGRHLIKLSQTEGDSSINFVHSNKILILQEKPLVRVSVAPSCQGLEKYWTAPRTRLIRTA